MARKCRATFAYTIYLQSLKVFSEMLMIWAIRTLATPLQLRKKISNRKDLKVSLRPESTLPVLTLVDFRQWEQYQIKLSFDLVQGVSTIAVEQVEQVMLDFRVPRCWRKLIEESAVEVKL